MFYSSLSSAWQSLCSSTTSTNSYLISSNAIAPGAICSTGGVQLSFGFDVNNNNVLDPSEVSASMNSYVCNGIQGPAGTNGIDGINGVDGAVGPAGPQGPIGLTGATGSAGPQGPAGTNGIDGINGVDGAAGPAGPQGPIGLTGATGPAGPAGPQGPIGLTGAQGPIGLTGASGPAGPQGPAGTNGIDGINGVDGAAGPQGPIGLTGATGPAGPAGPTGPQGPTWTITSDNFTAAGNLQIVTTYPQTVNSTNQAWLVGGNNFGTSATAYNFGTISNDHVDLLSNNTARGRIVNTGEFIYGNTAFVGSSMAGDVFTANKVNGGSANNWASNGINTTAGGGGGYFENTTSTNSYDAIQGIINYNGSAYSPAGVFGLAIAGVNAQTGIGVRGSTNGRNGYGVYGSRISNLGTGFGGLFLNSVGYTGSLTNLSDSRTKTNIRPLSNPLEIIKSLKGVNYEYDLEKYPYLGLSIGKQYGFIAQELESVVPELVELHSLDVNGCKPMEAKKESNAQLEEFKMVNYVGVIPILVEGMKEQQKIIEIQQKTIDELRSEIEKIKIEINKK